jgi:hypothetical protein
VTAAQARPDVLAAAPSVKIVSPSRCACGIVTPQPPTLTIVAQVKNFKLSRAHFGGAAAKGEGHLFFQLDGGKFDRPQYTGANARLAQQARVVGRFTPSVTNKLTYRNLPEGKHTVVVYLVGNDHKRLGPRDGITFTVS